MGYTGIKNAQVKFETKASNPMEFTGEVTYAKDKATVGMKLNHTILKGGSPELGIRYLTGPFFCSLVAKEAFQSFNACVFYKANDDLKCAALYTHGGKDNGKFSIGINHKALGKAKITQDQTVSFSSKYVVSKGFTLLGGLSYNMKKQSTT